MNWGKKNFKQIFGYFLIIILFLNLCGCISIDDSDHVQDDDNNKFPPKIHLYSPEGSYYNSTIQIEWNASDPDGDSISIVIYYLSTDGRWITIVKNNNKTGIYNWNISDLPIICNSKIKINVTDGKFYSENISQNFTIVPPSYNVKFVLNLQSYIKDIEWNHNYSKFASCTNNGYINIWNGTTYEKELTIYYNNSGEENHIYSISWSPDDLKLVSGGYDGYVKIWDTQTGKLLRKSSKYNGGISDITWNPDNSKIAVAFGNLENCVRILEPKTLEEIFYQKADYIVTSIIWNSDGSKVAYAVHADNMGSFPAKIFVLNSNNWSVNTILENNPIETPDGYANVIWDIDWSPDDSKIVAGFNDYNIVYWNLEENNKKNTISIHSGKVFTVRWNKNGNLILSGTEYGTIKIYDIITDKEFKKYNQIKHDVESLVWGENETEFICGYGYGFGYTFINESSLIIYPIEP